MLQYNRAKRKLKMIAKLALVLLVASAVSANPGASGPWRWVHKTISVSPNVRTVPFRHSANTQSRPIPRFADKLVKVENCGMAPLAPSFAPVIVGGTEASPHAYPWQVALYIDNMYFCGGSIISDEWVMTAAHCMDGAGFVDVVAGAHDITKKEPTQVTIRSTDSFVHEDWKPFLIKNDIAMIHLPTKLTFNDYIQPVCLPKKSESDLGADVEVMSTGWGKTHDGFGGTSNVLMQVEVPTITNSQCAQTYGATITNDMICIDSAGGHGTCNGDSGGPLNYKIGGVTETRGIVSFGSAAGCEAGYPDAYTRVSHYLDWIEAHTGVTY